MNIRVSCEKCGQSFQAKAKFAGRKVKCKGCGHIFVLPKPEPGDSPPEKSAPAEEPAGEQAPKGEVKKAPDAETPEKAEEKVPEKEKPEAPAGEPSKKPEPAAAKAPEAGKDKPGKETPAEVGKKEEEKPAGAKAPGKEKKDAKEKKADKEKEDDKGKKDRPRLGKGKKAGTRRLGGKDPKKKTARKTRGETAREKKEKKEGEAKSPLPLVIAGCAGLFLLFLIVGVIILVAANPFGSGDESAPEETSASSDEGDKDEVAPADESPDEEPGEEVEPGGETPDEEPGEETPDEEPGEEVEPGEETPDEEPGEEIPGEEPGEEVEPGEETPDEEPGEEVEPGEESPDEEPGEEIPDEEPGEEVEPGEEIPEEPAEPPEEDPREAAEKRGRQLIENVGTLDDPTERAGAVSELGRFLAELEAGEFTELREEGFQSLLGALEDDEAPVRAESAVVLGSLGDDRAVDPLIGRLLGDDESVQARSAEALTAITGADLGVSYENWMIWKETGISDPSVIEERRAQYREFSAGGKAEEAKGNEADLGRALDLWKKARENALTAGEKAEADGRITELETALEKRKAGLDAKVQEAKEALEAGQKVKAKDLCEQVLKTDPNHAGAKEILEGLTAGQYAAAMEAGRKAEEGGDLEGARAEYEKALRSRADDPEAKAALERLAVTADYAKAMAEGAKAEEAKDWNAAQEAYRRALEIKPGDEEAARRLEKAQMLPFIAVLRRYFVLPSGDRDQHGNPVVTRGEKRHDPLTGLPCEIWLKKPCIEFVLVPPGEFSMGSPEDEFGRADAEGPMHTVVFTRPFYVAKYEVTQAQWLEVMGGDPAKFPNATHPVGGVSWTQGKGFVEKLTALLGVDAEAPLGLRFPSEAQWEYACRAGSTTQYGFGDADEELGNYAWFAGNAGDQTHPVGKKKPNGFGLYDMHGGVAEWVEDLVATESYEGAPADGSVWKAEGGRIRIVRGGSWKDGDVRSAARRYKNIKGIRKAVGFRLVAWPALGE
jgi:formylglycine-generating enzyme required for sulfatase activity